MSTLDIRLDDALKVYLDAQVARRGYRDASEFIESLLEADRRQQIRAEVESALLETADGPFSDLSEEDFDDVRRVGQRFLSDRARRAGAASSARTDPARGAG
jgi:Arc/MetJ-type ribon-helix-helix transcriptional regulator